jgi:hypothetical protein
MKPTSGLGCTTRKTPGSIGRSAKPGYQGADRYSDADTGKLAARRKPLQAPAALVAPSAPSVYSSADKVGHTMPYTQQREGRINKLSQTALPNTRCWLTQCPGSPAARRSAIPVCYPGFRQHL